MRATDCNSRVSGGPFVGVRDGPWQNRCNRQDE